METESKQEKSVTLVLGGTGKSGGWWSGSRRAGRR
jgi:hypothetical protein